ncbi:MAG: sortase [Lawsonibacter sp.]|nr:sortase [Lawsonibacter sp.]
MRNRHGLGFMAGGLLLLAAALCLSIYNIWDDNRAAIAAETNVKRLNTAMTETVRGELPVGMLPDYVLAPEMEMPTITIDGLEYIGRLDIPVLELSLPVLSQWSYPNMKVAPCRYSGSLYQNNMVIAAHNYKRHFGSLKTLEVGDTVRFTDVEGNEFRYTVAELEQLAPNEVEAMITGDWDLTLFTCTAGAQYRVTVRCVLEEESLS